LRGANNFMDMHLTAKERLFIMAEGEQVDSEQLFNADGLEVLVKITDQDDEETFTAMVYEASHFHLRVDLTERELQNILTPESWEHVKKFAERMWDRSEESTRGTSACEDNLADLKAEFHAEHRRGA
jgi:hypothetical protein